MANRCVKKVLYEGERIGIDVQLKTGDFNMLAFLIILEGVFGDLLGVSVVLSFEITVFVYQGKFGEGAGVAFEDKRSDGDDTVIGPDIVVGVGIVGLESAFGGGIFFPTGLGDKDTQFATGFVLEPGEFVFETTQGVLTSASRTTAKSRIGVRVGVPVVNFGKNIWMTIEHASEEIESFHSGGTIRCC